PEPARPEGGGDGDPEGAGEGELLLEADLLHVDGLLAAAGAHGPAPAGAGVKPGGQRPGLDGDDEDVVGAAGYPRDLAERGAEILDVLEDAGDEDDGGVVGDVGDRALGDVGDDRHRAGGAAVLVD